MAGRRSADPIFPRGAKHWGHLSGSGYRLFGLRAHDPNSRAPQPRPILIINNTSRRANCRPTKWLSACPLLTELAVDCLEKSPHGRRRDVVIDKGRANKCGRPAPFVPHELHSDRVLHTQLSDQYLIDVQGRVVRREHRVESLLDRQGSATRTRLTCRSRNTRPFCYFSVGPLEPDADPPGMTLAREHDAIDDEATYVFLLLLWTCLTWWFQHNLIVELYDRDDAVI